MLKVTAEKFESKTFAGRYKILEKIGEGGMGNVFKANDSFLKKDVVIKVISRDLSEQAALRMQTEAKATAALKHSNIISILDFGVDSQSSPYMVMEFLQGKDLARWLKEKGTLNLGEFLSIFNQALSALEHAHAKKILHRDLKPSNIMISDLDSGSPHVTLLDFGIAKILESEQRLTTTGMLLGSPLYMSPEQISLGELDARSDIYSLGCVMYECLTGIPPFKGATALETMQMHANDQPTPPSDLSKKEIPDRVEAAVMKCLKKSKEERYQSVKELKHDIAHGAGVSDGLSVEQRSVHAGSVDNSKENSTSITYTDVLHARKSTERFQSIAMGLVGFCLFILAVVGITFWMLSNLEPQVSEKTDLRNFASLQEPPARDLSEKKLLLRRPNDADFEWKPEERQIDRLIVVATNMNEARYKAIGRLPNLSWLIVDNSDDLGGESIKELAHGSRHVSKLELTHSVVNTDVCDGLLQLPPFFYLGVHKCRGLSDDVMKRLQQVKVRALTLSADSELTDDKLVLLNGSKIEQLRLSNNPQLTMNGLSKLKLPKLGLLDMSGCSGISAENVMQLSKQFKLKAHIDQDNYTFIGEIKGK